MDALTELGDRQSRVREAAARAGLHGVVALGRAFYDRPGPCAWLSGHYPPFLAAEPLPGLRGAGHAAFIVPLDGPSTLVCDPTGTREDLVLADALRSSDDVWHALIGSLETSGLARGRVGLAGADLLPWPIATAIAAELPGLALHPFDDVLDELRQIKSPREQALLRASAACADAGLAVAIGLLRDGASERAAAAAGTGAAIDAGADHVRYLRVHSGVASERTARWPPALDRVPRAGELVMVDVIGACNGYAFDVARTIAIGDPSPAQQAALAACGAAADASAAACRAGARVSHVLDAAARTYEAAGLAADARAFVGHGIGIETVEWPLLSRSSPDLELLAGMVLCIEPGVSIAGVGGALIEHEVIVTDGAPQILCRTPTHP
jgi:Xaa-Pro dipeptidase